MSNQIARPRPDLTAVVVSPHFPPSTLAGVHRARHLVKHLPAHGVRPILVRVDPEHYTEPGDPALAALVPPDVEEVAVGAVPASLTGRFGLRDVGMRAYVPLRRAVLDLVARERPDVVLITGAPYYPLLISRAVARTGTPVIVDLQDPWVASDGADHSLWSKRRASHILAQLLEGRAMEPAAAITSVSDRQNEELVERLPRLRGRPMAGIPIGGDPEDFDALRARPPMAPMVRLDPARTNLSYIGNVWSKAVPTLDRIMAGLARLAASEPDLAQRLRVNFVGTSNQPAGGPRVVVPIAERHGVSHLVMEEPRRVPYLEALSLQANSDGLLLVGSDEPHYTASKIYPAMMSGTPFLSLFHADSSAHAILSRAGGGLAHAFSNEAELDALVEPLARSLHRLATDPSSLGRTDPAAYADTTAHAVAGRFAELMRHVASGAA